MNNTTSILQKLLFLLLLSTTAFALDPRRALRQYIHESWTTANGLPQSSAFAIRQDKDGYIWFGTEEGIVRFDGTHFTVFDRKNTPELESNNFRTIIEDKEGAYWFIPIGPQGITRMKDGKFKLFSVKEGLPTSFRTRTVVDSTGALWVSSFVGVSHLVGDRFVTLTKKDGLPSDSIFGLTVDHKGRIWMGSNYHTCIYENGKISMLDGSHGVSSDSIGFFKEDYKGNMWCFRPNNIEVISPEGKSQRYTAHDGLSDAVVNSIVEDSHHQLWIATNNGLDRFENGTFVHMRIDSKNVSHQVFGIYEDHEGTIWTRVGGGLGRLNNGVIEVYSKEDGLPQNDVRSIFEDREGSLWIGVYGSGLFRLRDTKFVTLSMEEGLTENLVNAVFEDNLNGLWVGTFSGALCHYVNGTTVSTFKEGYAPGISGGIAGITQDRNGTMWYISGGVGLFTIPPGSSKAIRVKSAIPILTLNSMCTDSMGTVWIGSASGIYYGAGGEFRKLPGVDGGVSTFCVGRNDMLWVGIQTGIVGINVKSHTIQNYPLDPSIMGRSINAIHESSDGSLWLGTVDQGIMRFKEGKTVSITPKDGLFDYNAFSMLEDETGNLWMDCNKGIYRVSLSDLNAFADGKINHVACTSYGLADGMKNPECNGGSYPCAWKRHDGQLCFANVGGVATIYPADIKLNMVPPSVVIEQTGANQQALDPRIKNILPPGTEKFEFHFAGISFLSADKIQFKYKLEPFETEWVDAGTRRDAYYTHIPPGSYTFKVKAANSDGVWNELGASTEFILKPHFYESMWFIGLCIFGFVSVGPGIYFMRVRQLKHREAELKQLVDRRTHELQDEKSNVEKALEGLKEAQNKLVLSEKMASLGQLTAGIAHEIKNPLNFVTNFSSLSSDLMGELEEEIQSQSEKIDPKVAGNIKEIVNDLRQNVTKINEHGKRADSIVRGMLLHSRGRSGERQMTDLNAMLAEYTNLAYHGLRAQDTSFNVKIETDFDSTIGMVNIVPQDLSRVFLNIINNACYAAFSKSKNKAPGFSPTIRVSSKDLGNSFEVHIRDNGNGIPAHVRDKIFNPFFTTKPAGVGTGLGLSLSYDIVTQEHKGEIAVHTEEGEFTEFVVTIPK